MRRDQRTVWAAALLVAAGGIVVATIGGRDDAPATSRVTTRLFFSELRDDAVLSFAPTSVVKHDGTSSRVLVTRMRTYSGPLADPYIDAVVAAGKADALEWRLTSDAQSELARRIEEVNTALWEVTMSCLEEEETAQRKLRDRDKDVWIMQDYGNHPAHDRAVYAKFMDYTQGLTKKRAATTATEFRSGDMYYYLLRRSEFPEYWHYLDMQVALLQERRERVADAVTSMYRDQGIHIFDPNTSRVLTSR